MSSRLQVRRVSPRRLLTIFFGIGLICLIIFLLLYRLNNWPSIYWDEGWTLSAARNWIERGHLGNYLDQQPVPPRIPVRFPVLLPVALSMKVLGVGTWQGRLPGVIFTLLSLGLVGILGTKIFNRRAGIAAAIIVLCISVYIYHPLVIGRQVMAEMPMMFYLLCGYWFIWLALTKSPWWGVAAALSFGIAIHAKLQVPPFWLVSIVLAIWMSISQGQRNKVLILISIFIGSLLMAGIVLLVQNLLMPGSFEGLPLTILLFNSVIFVPIWAIRSSALTHVFLFAFTILLGYIWSGWQTLRYLSVRKQSKYRLDQSTAVDIEILKIGLWGLGASWLFWYAAMAINWIRYMFPPLFIGSIFLAGYLNELTNGFDLRILLKRSSSLALKGGLNFLNLQSFIMIVALCINLGAAILSDQIGLSQQQYNPELAASYLQKNIPANALVETFESELYFLAPSISYHFPSDLVSLQAQRKTTIDKSFTIDYDPLKANPDYLVVGPMGNLWPIYDNVIAQNKFQFIVKVGDYKIYKKIGPSN